MGLATAVILAGRDKPSPGSSRSDAPGDAAVVRGNRIAPGIDYEVGIDDSSEDGYEGPEPGGGP